MTDNSDNKLSVLVFDDDIQIVNLIKTFLNQEGFNVLCPQNMAQCLKIVESLEPDLLLLDVILKSSDGFQILRTIRDVSLTKNMPIIIMTSLSEEEALEKAADSGASDFIKKPFELDELKNAILRQLFPPEIDLIKKILINSPLIKLKTHKIGFKDWFVYSINVNKFNLIVNSKNGISELLNLSRKELKKSLRVFIKIGESFYMIWPFRETPEKNATFRVNVKISMLEKYYKAC